MTQTKEQIEAHIDQARTALNSNLHELENKAVSAMDWKHHFDEKPGTLLAVAFVGGVALSMLVGGRRTRAHYNGAAPSAPQLHSSRGQSEVWNRVKGALIGLAAARITDYAGSLFPGSGSPSRPKYETPNPRGFSPNV